MQKRLIAVGDIHGEIEKLNSLLNKLDLQSNDRIIFLGDYIDRGKHSKEVIVRLIELSKTVECIFLKGNHEDMLLKTRISRKQEDIEHWLLSGGIETYDNYGDYPTIFSTHGQFLDNLKLYHIEQNYLFVHAGVNPNKNLSDQTEDDLLWIRDEFYEHKHNLPYKIIFGHIFNDKSGEKDTEYFNLTLKSKFGYKKSGIEIKEVAKSNLNKFQEALSLFDNHFQTNFYQNEFKTFFEEFIQPKLKSKTVIIYENIGKIKSNTFLGADFYIENDKIYKEDEQGLIPTTDNNVFIKVHNKYPFKLPTLCQSDKKPSIIAKDFMANIIESWGKNYVSALLVIGHMIMGLYFERFISGTGIPTLIIAGISGCGKSTLVQNGIAIFGLDDDFLIAGNSTVLVEFSGYSPETTQTKSNSETLEELNKIVKQIT